MNNISVEFCDKVLNKVLNFVIGCPAVRTYLYSRVQYSETNVGFTLSDYIKLHNLLLATSRPLQFYVKVHN